MYNFYTRIWFTRLSNNRKNRLFIKGTHDHLEILFPSAFQELHVVAQQLTISVAEHTIDTDVNRGIAHDQQIAPWHEHDIQVAKLQFLHDIHHKGLNFSSKTQKSDSRECCMSKRLERLRQA